MLLAAQDKVTALTVALDDARAVRTIVAGRQQAGAKSPYELERTDLALAALASKRDEAATDIAAASGALAQAVGLPDWQPRAAGTFKLAELAAPAGAAAGPSSEAPNGALAGAPSVAIDHPELVAEPTPGPSLAPAVAIDHPELVASVAAQALARSEQALAHAEAVPTPSLQLQGFGTTDPQGIALTVGFAIPLPVFDRNQGAIARARAQEHAAELDHRATTSELAGELVRAVAIEHARRVAAAQFEADAIERLLRVRTMAEASYRAGQGSIVELLDALDAITEARLREIELVAAALEAGLEVRAAAHGR